jgi:tRNA(Ile)-lysidine synthase
MLQSFITYIAQEHLFDKGNRILLAVSGGIDSVAMCHLFSEAGFKFGIAHCNFALRGEESVRDENFVRQLAEQLNVPFYTTLFDTAGYAEKQHVSIQVAARELRYDWLESMRITHGYDLIATAHHMQDNVETVLMNLAKGTGIAGLHGILPKQGKLVRPLLFARKEDFPTYPFVEDSSNATVKYTRNFFRHRVIPVMAEAYPGVVPHISASIERFREAEVLYTQAVELHKKKLLRKDGAAWKIAVLQLQKTAPLQTVAWEIFKDFGCSPGQLQAALDLLDSGPGKVLETATHRILRDRKWLLITALNEPDATVVSINEDRAVINVSGGQLKIKSRIADTSFRIPVEPNIACLNRSELQFPLILRKWRQGDYFYPLGMRKKKKLSRFFIDQKLSLVQKEKVWVIESAKRIVWVVGMRIDDRFRVTTDAKDLLQLEWTPITR